MFAETAIGERFECFVSAGEVPARSPVLRKDATGEIRSQPDGAKYEQFLVAGQFADAVPQIVEWYEDGLVDRSRVD